MCTAGTTSWPLGLGAGTGAVLAGAAGVGLSCNAAGCSGIPGRARSSGFAVAEESRSRSDILDERGAGVEGSADLGVSLNAAM